MAFLINTIVSVAILAVSCSAREYNCTMDEALCTGNMMQTLVMSGRSVCCPQTATFKFNADQCLCSEPNVVEECLQGVPQCRQAESFTRDSNQVVRCCMPGYRINNVQSVVNGMSRELCTCTPMLTAGGIMSSIFGMPNLGGGQGGAAGPVFPVVRDRLNLNRTQVRDQWKQMGQDWGQAGRDFVQGMRQWGTKFGGGMRQVGRDLVSSLSSIFQSSLGQSAGPLRTAFGDMMSQAFSSIPGLQRLG